MSYPANPPQGSGAFPPYVRPGADQPRARPGSVTAAAVIGLVYSALMVLVAIGMTALVGGGLGIALALINLVLATALAWAAFVAFRGESGTPLLAVSLVIMGVNAISLIVLVLNDGQPGLGILGIVIPGLIFSNIVNGNSKAYFAR
ncbi:hypothetical protein GII33_18125 [Gordonia pseudamarae]|jgi:hypothetical protein|uniref:Integral membrane protein n=1 Tax=Gordonia pseudamarae TaxID=2831662 RepID=A0ABX6ILA3_9ACTN|nr:MULTISPECIES: hypothetical protein [Gordonia]MBD0021236.1 hypothetical protein [Gordonia sp. (in: high G+C Gram-positive bacteria)]QHN27600.1 hypothetical protein GII33_18125 [Gordonia pseudamarae]QHN36482.1 hypothetical protein GII31_17900 [Gordonia pseudamarae]